MSPPTARFTLDVDAFVEGIVRGTAPSIRRAQVRYAAYAAVFLALWVLSDRLASDGRVNASGVLWLACAGGFGLAAALRPVLYRRQLERLLAGRADLGRRVEVRLSEHELAIDVEQVRTTTQRLSTIAGIQAFDDGVLLEVLAREFLWIPSGAFGDRDGQGAFVRHVLERAPLPDASL